ncbi:hypothetical protein Tco_0904982 [Tanacetum coccineum]
MANKKTTNKKITEEIDPFDDPKFGEYYIENEHLFVPTQTSAEKKKDQTDDVNWESFLENEEEIIRKGREFSVEQRKKAKQQERERQRKGKKENDQIGSSSQDSTVFGIDNSLLAVELTEDEKLLGRSIFSTQEEEEEVVFNDDERTILFRMNIQLLAPGLEIDTSVIDTYISILNYEEKFKMTNMKRHFFYTSMMVPGILEDKTKEIDKKIDAQYDRFHEMLSNQMENDVEKTQMKDVKLLYEGSTAAQWKIGLLPENDKNHRIQMDNLRSRIATKILLHDVNIYQKKMSSYEKKMTEAGEGGSNRE